MMGEFFIEVHIKKTSKAFQNGKDQVAKISSKALSAEQLSGIGTWFNRREATKQVSYYGCQEN